MSNAKKPKGLREALKRRQVKTTAYRLPLSPAEEIQKKAEALSLARNTVAAAEYLQQREDRPDVAEALANAKKARELAQAELDECFWPIVFAQLPEDDFDDLVNAHPPTAAQVTEAKANGDDVPLYNRDTFFPDLFALSAQGAGLTAEEWAEELKGWGKGEKAEIRAKALEANIRSMSAGIPFG